ncbi:MAG TPA: nitrilase-related carbon-nitrogen hydrolase [Longimicrobiales bacterium]|nr:nitrilase-related carbon-nitrogen hydrolase [Longimicrobiales bacterium]
MSDQLHVSLLQTAPRLADVEGNAARILEATPRLGRQAALCVAPELALSGYDLRDAAPDVALTSPQLAARLAPGGAVVAGFPERAADGAVYNSVGHVESGRVVFVHRKVHLPTYGMFDEARVFAAGADIGAYEWNGWRLGLLVCEDFWHPGLLYALCAQRVELIIAVAAAPGRGVFEAEGAARFASWETWRRMASVYARVFGIWIALANRAGVEEGVTFAGGSLIAAPDGSLIASAPEGEVAVVGTTLDRGELARLRTPAWHGRDDRPLVVARALLRAEGIE